MKKGTHHSKESKLKLSLAKKGKKFPNHSIALKKHWAKYGHSCTGRKMSEETRKKIGDANRGKKRTPEAREKIRLALLNNKYSLGYNHTKKARLNMSKGQKKRVSEGRHHCWKGGVSKINKTKRNLIMGGLKYRWWRERVFKRDKYQCVIGGKKHGNKLEVHHIKSYAKYPKLRYKISNGITLCQKCHRETETYAGKTNN